MPNAHRRASLAVGSTSSSTDDTEQVSSYAENSCFYHPHGSGGQMGGSQLPSSSSLSFHSSPPSNYFLGTLATTNSPHGAAPAPIALSSKNRRKAVLTVDAKTTEILIASDSICRLFGLKDRSLIGKKLADVFSVESPSLVVRKLSNVSRKSEQLDERKGPLILGRNILFNENARLCPVYGKPVDIIDVEGNKSTVCVWSYPLTTTAALVARRKNSAIFVRSPSAFLTPTKLAQSPTSDHQKPSAQPNGLLCSFLTTSPTNRQDSSSDFSPDRAANPSAKHRTSSKDAFPPDSVAPGGTDSLLASKLHLPASSADSAAQPQRSKSTCAAYSPYLKVLHEEPQPQETSNNQLTTGGLSLIDNTHDRSENTGDQRATEERPKSERPPSSALDHCGCPPELDDKKRGGAMVESSVCQQHNNSGDSVESTDGEESEPGEPREGESNAKVSSIANQNDNMRRHHHHSTKDEEEKSKAAAGNRRLLRDHTDNFLCNRNHLGVDQFEDDDDDENPVARRWLITMEPINALHFRVILGAKGRIFRTDDDSLASVLGYECTNRLFGTEIHRLIPSLNIGVEWDGKEQLCCGVTLRRNGVPFSITLASQCDLNPGVASSYEMDIRSLSSINGVITITDSGFLYSYNENFLHELVGQDFTSSVSKKTELEITDFVPRFYEYLEAACPGYREKREAENQTAERVYVSDSFSSSSSTPTDHSRSTSGSSPFTPTDSRASSNSGYTMATLEMGNHEQQKHIAEKCAKERANGHHFGTLPHHHEIIPGTYFGLAKHIDGSLIPIKFDISELPAPSSPKLFNVCIGFDRSNDYGINQLPPEAAEEEDSLQQQNESTQAPVLAKMTKFPGGLHPFSTGNHPASATTSMLIEEGEVHDKYNATAAKFSIGGGGFRECESEAAVELITSSARTSNSAEEVTKSNGSSLHTLEDENNEAVRGEYSKFYNTFERIQDGAFGSVKLAARKDTGLLAVSKFICKSKVLPESWVQSPKRGNRMVPIEVHLLENLQHPNIVRVLDVFENERYYQLVMEKLGCGMDLFEFIENQPKLDEPLTSYIFRQIVGAVDYLHENHIVHRDLKDENVIIDQNFCCKLIDFGSAAFFGNNIVFSTFCGTFEYCSPEVLTGNKYLGPELEMWSLGILLYTLVFFVNPFTSIVATVKADFELPCEISEGLYQVLNFLLLPDPKSRATVGEIKRHWWVTQKVNIQKYKFQDVLKNCERAQVKPPLYISDLQNHLKNASSCGNPANNGPIATALDTESTGIISAR